MEEMLRFEYYVKLKEGYRPVMQDEEEIAERIWKRGSLWRGLHWLINQTTCPVCYEVRKGKIGLLEESEKMENHQRKDIGNENT